MTMGVGIALGVGSGVAIGVAMDSASVPFVAIGVAGARRSRRLPGKAPPK